MDAALRYIGWKEFVDLPDLGLYNVPAKVDTGARTSVLHCSKIELIEGEDRVRFTPLDERYANTKESLQSFVMPYHSERMIKNSFGLYENRYVIRTVVRMFDQVFDIELSLRDRSEMEFPVLLGRSFIRKKFMVDVSQSNLTQK